MKESLKGVKLLPKMRVSKAFENEGEENENRANKFFIQGELYLIKSVRMYSMVPDCAHGQNKNIMGIFCKTTT